MFDRGMPTGSKLSAGGQPKACSIHRMKQAEPPGWKEIMTARWAMKR